MPKVGQIGNVILKIYINDHAPPHLHAIAPDFYAKIAIETAEVMEGNARPRQLKEVLRHVAERRASLLEIWTRYHA